MKKVFLSILLSLGVVLAMMGSPAQGNDEQAGDVKKGKPVAVVTGRKIIPVHHGHDFIKFECKVKKIDESKIKKLKKPDLIIIDSSKLTHQATQENIKPIVVDPIGPPIGGPQGGGCRVGLLKIDDSNKPLSLRDLLSTY